MTTGNMAFVFAAVVTATGGIVGMQLDSAMAEEWATMNRAQAYAAARVDTAFDLVAVLPESAPVMLPLAQKGDLPVPFGCLAILGDAQAECMDVAYEIPSEPSIVIETRDGTTTTLLRMDAWTVAGVSDPELPQAE